MTRWVKTLAVQAWEPEFGSQSLHKSWTLSGTFFNLTTPSRRCKAETEESSEIQVQLLDELAWHTELESI